MWRMIEAKHVLDVAWSGRWFFDWCIRCIEADTSVQREPFDFGGITSFQAVCKGFGEQDKAVIFRVFVGMLVARLW